MNSEMKIEWLESFITIWDISSDYDANCGVKDFDTLAPLCDALTNFCTAHGLPQWSADDIVVMLKGQ